jgi:hypothetical protein
MFAALGERLHAERGEHLVRGAQLRPRADPPGLAAQPLAIEQVRASSGRKPVRLSRSTASWPEHRMTPTGRISPRCMTNSHPVRQKT